MKMKKLDKILALLSIASGGSGLGMFLFSEWPYYDVLYFYAFGLALSAYFLKNKL